MNRRNEELISNYITWCAKPLFVVADDSFREPVSVKLIAGISLVTLLTNSDGNHVYRSLRPIAWCLGFGEILISSGVEP
jgi:hypothetical protein